MLFFQPCELLTLRSSFQARLLTFELLLLADHCALVRGFLPLGFALPLRNGPLLFSVNLA